MSVALTEDAVVARQKTVTRRLGWWDNRRGHRILHPEQTLTLCRKVQGRKPDEPIVRLAEVQVVDMRREPLSAITLDEVTREGFPGWTTDQFIDMFVASHRGSTPDTTVTRIEWRYVELYRGRTIVAYATCQMGAARGQYVTHLVRSAFGGGTPGPTLCGIDRFAPTSPGWSIAGGVTGGDTRDTPCPDCNRARDIGLEVYGLAPERFTAERAA